MKLCCLDAELSFLILIFLGIFCCLYRLAFFRTAYSLYDADFYMKIDDDIYLRPGSFRSVCVLALSSRMMPLSV